MNSFQHRINIPGWIGVACLLFVWSAILLPKSVKPLLPVFDKIGPFSWLLPLAMIALPIVAARRGSKWWWAVTAAAIITLFAFLRVVLT
jgi:hypothetical protein